MKRETTITLDELLEEMEKIRDSKVSIIEITPEQKKFLLAARNNDRPISFSKIQELWGKKWHPISDSALRRRYKIIMNEQKRGKI